MQPQLTVATCRERTPGESSREVQLVLLRCQVRLLTSRVYTLGAWLSAPSIISWPSPPYRISCLPPAYPKDVYISKFFTSNLWIYPTILSFSHLTLTGLSNVHCSSSCIVAQHGSAQHSTAQHSTAQHSTAQHGTAQHSTAFKSKQHVQNFLRRWCAGHKATDSMLLCDSILRICAQIHGV